MQGAHAPPPLEDLASLRPRSPATENAFLGMGMRKILFRIVVALVVFAGAVYIWNASWRTAMPAGETRLIAHRGVHQTYSREGLENDTCTAERILPPTHDFLENTLPSMRAAFAAGADVIELDVHPTTDGRFAVMHDWTVDCRTEGTGETRSHDLAYLKSLDIGYGYTADGGQTFPFRGKGVGMMPAIEEVLAAFPDRRFLVNYKSNEEREGDILAALLEAHPEWRPLVWGVYGGGPPTERAREFISGNLVAFSSRQVIQCLLQYLGVGWTGYVPEPCRDTAVMVPINLAWLIWGWPNLFVERMRAAGSEVILLGPYGAGDVGTSGVDTLELLAQVPQPFAGYVWTNRIEVIGPALATRRQ
jgi:glycerophosphoryl diester phosphodiesterase